MTILFWLLAAFIFYTYAGYPLLLLVVSLFAGNPGKYEEPVLPSVSIVICAYNEERTVEKKIQNCLGLDYPKDKLEILIGSDGSTDKTDGLIKSFGGDGVKLYRSETRGGKPGMLNELVSRARGEIIVFTDARQSFDKMALRALANSFFDETIGSVSGELVLRGAEHSSIGGVSTYWNYEKFLRKLESKISSMVGATGAIYAIRKKLFTPVPVDIILDDVFVPLKVVEKGFRAVFEPKALAYDDISKTAAAESDRKKRTLAGNWQIFFRLPQMFNPFKSGVAIQLFSHKLLRVLMPFFLLALFVDNAFLLDKMMYRVFFGLQSVFYLTALAGLKIPYAFCALNIMAVQGFWAYVSKKQTAIWKS